MTCFRQGFIAHLVEHPTDIAEVMGSNPIGASECFHEDLFYFYSLSVVHSKQRVVNNNNYYDNYNNYKSTKNTAILQGKQTKGLKRIAGQKVEREKQANKEIKRQNITKHKMWSKFVTNPVLYFSFHIHRFFPSMFSIHNRYIKIDCRLRLCPLQGILGTVTIADPDLKRLAKLRSYIQRRSGCSGYVTDMRKRIFSSVVHDMLDVAS